MAAKSSVGWLILAGALAVPGVLFYQWYTHLDKAEKRELNFKVRSRIPDGGPFASSPDNNKLVNPIAASQSRTAAGAAPAPSASALNAAPARASQIPHPVAAGAAAVQPRAASGGVQAPAASVSGAAPAPAPQLAPAVSQPAPVAAAAPSAVSSAPAANLFASWRDPTLSPFDHARLEKNRMDQLLREQDIRDRLAREKRPKVKKELDISTTVHLQGIISTSSGNKAIVNGEAVAEGDMVGQVKVLRITTQKVFFVYKNKRFFKSVNK